MSDKDYLIELDRLNGYRTILNETITELHNSGYSVSVDDKLYDPLIDTDIPIDSMMQINRNREHFFNRNVMEIDDRIMHHEMKMIHHKTIIAFAQSSVILRKDNKDKDNRLMIARTMAENTCTFIKTMLQYSIGKHIDEIKRNKL